MESRGVTLENESYIYSWNEERQQLVVSHSTVKRAVGKELFQALNKNVKDRKSVVSVMTKSQVNKTLHKLTS